MADSPSTHPITERVFPKMPARPNPSQPRKSRFKEHLDDDDLVVTKHPPGHPAASVPELDKSQASDDKSNQPKHDRDDPTPRLARSSSHPTTSQEKKGAIKSPFRRVFARLARSRKLPKVLQKFTVDADKYLQNRNGLDRGRSLRRTQSGSGLSFEQHHHEQHHHEQHHYEQPFAKSTGGGSSMSVGSDIRGREGAERIAEPQTGNGDWSTTRDLQDTFSTRIHTNSVEREQNSSRRPPIRFMNTLEQRLDRNGDRPMVPHTPVKRYQLVESYVSDAKEYHSDDEAVEKRP